MSRHPWEGGVLLSFKVSDELAKMIDVAATHEHRNRSQLIRRAVMLYLEEGEYFKPGLSGLDTGSSIVGRLVEEARKELDDAT